MRYKITFELLEPDDTASYEVYTCNGETKAIVIATQKHNSSSKGHILSVEVTHLGGTKAVGTDLVDRMEW